MAGRRYSKADKKEYYNHIRIQDIEYKISIRELDTALLMVNDYILNYPDDKLGIFLLAIIYAKQAMSDKNLLQKPVEFSLKEVYREQFDPRYMNPVKTFEDRMGIPFDSNKYEYRTDDGAFTEDGEIVDIIFYEKVPKMSGKAEEAYNIAKEAYENNRFHNVQASIDAARYYSKLLIILEKYDEAERVLLKALDNNRKGSLDYLSMKTVYILIQLYIDLNDYDKALSLIDRFLEDVNVNDKDELLVKKGMIYRSLGRLHEAVELLETVNGKQGKSLTTQDKFLCLGETYYDLYKIKGDPEYLQKAEESTKKALNIKNIDYYFAIQTLANICYRKHDYEQALQYCNTVIEKKETPLVTEECSNDAYKVASYVYLKNGDIEKAKEYIECITNKIDHDFLLAKYYYGLKEYDECIKLLCPVLCECTEDEIPNFASQFIDCYVRKGDLDRAKYFVQCLYDDLNVDYKKRFYALYRKNKGIRTFIERGDQYTIQQIKDYSEELAIEHIINNHVDEGFGYFDDKQEVRKALEFAREKIKTMNYIPTNLMDKYLIKDKDMEGKQFGDCNGMVAIALMGTNDITTLYPISSCRSSYKSEQESKDIKVRSGLDRFNQRYGNK